jgi:glycosyltransferase involved in cell wall biosynthesis
MTICLCMIVKNEAHCVERAIKSALPITDSWLVIDTGSTDGTQKIIRKLLAGLPGELHEKPWVNFGHNRTELVELARGRADYLLLLDADMEIADYGFDPGKLDKDVYLIRYEGDLDYAQKLLIRGDLHYSYVGVTHEYLTSPDAKNEAELKNLRMIHHGDGSSTRTKFVRDEALLRRHVIVHPNDSRAMFYLAQSLKGTGKLDEAIRVYRMRAKMGGWQEEAWYALYQAARLLDQMSAPHGEVLAAYLEAYNKDPGRAEPLYWLARRERLAGRYGAATVFARAGLVLPYPKSILFVERDVYEWKLMDELAISTWWAGGREESARWCSRLLNSPTLPIGERARVRKNLEFGQNRMQLEAIEISTVGSCPAHCRYCPQDKLAKAYDGKPRMTLRDFKQIAAKIKPVCNRIDFSGFVEPFLNPYCIDMIEHAHREGFIVRLYTSLNGASLKDVQRLGGLGIEYICLHLATSGMKIIVDDNYISKVLWAVQNLSPDLWLLDGPVHPDLVAAIPWLGKIKENVVISRAGNSGAVEAYSRPAGTKLNCPGRGYNHPVIMPDGTAALCCQDYEIKHRMGNLLRDSLDAFLGSSEYRRVHHGLSGRLATPILCNRCEYARC